ncbi:MULTISPECIES: hypothetical protein [Mycetohabitans]|uniref:hypothetical protein n=1 Tax=Mycetohabitans TaxID=2571159 RepID=UPI00030B598D|nr:MULTISPECIES: hypothetical protein [Mycetohabitans]MCF7695257.1 hypothetical protein [Mycetohabitans sp. B2]
MSKITISAESKHPAGLNDAKDITPPLWDRMLLRSGMSDSAVALACFAITLGVLIVVNLDR